MNIYAQLIGIIALILMVISYQQKNRKKFLIYQVFANLFYGLQYFILNAFSALCSNIVTIIKTIIFYKKEKEDKRTSVYTLILIELIFISIGFFTYEGVYSVIPIVIACLYTYGTWQRNLKLTYSIGIIVAVLWILYNSIVGAYVGVIGAVFELFSSSIGLIRLLRSKESEK